MCLRQFSESQVFSVELKLLKNLWNSYLNVSYNIAQQNVFMTVFRRSGPSFETQVTENPLKLSKKYMYSSAKCV